MQVSASVETISLTKPNETMSRLNPGYFTDFSAFLICSWVKAIGQPTLRRSDGKTAAVHREIRLTRYKHSERCEGVWGAHAPRVLAMAPRHRELFASESIAARRRNEHARARALPRDGTA